MPRQILRAFLLTVIIFLLISCGNGRAPTLEKEKLFSVNYGKMEDELALFMTGGAVARRTHHFMENGLFRIASGYGNKIMEFTSFGDLISLYYDPDENPAPILLQTNPDPDRISTRRAFAFPFNKIGEIAETSGGILLVEDEVPTRVAEFDEELGVTLNRIVVRFDSNGNQLDYLGQEGIGGTYLPYVQRIETTSNDEVVVVTTAPPRTIIYWYAPDGTILRKIEITPDRLPVPSDLTTVPVLETVYPDRDLRRLYLKVNYYVYPAPGEAAENGEANRLMSRIYWLNISDGTYGGFVDVPRNVKPSSETGQNGRQQEFQYEFIGTAPGEHLFLLSQESTEESQLLILQTSGRVVRRRTLEIDYNEVIYRDLHISRGGILSGLLATRDDVQLVWWRTDRLFEGAN